MNISTISIILSVCIECALLIYYCGSLFEYRESRTKSCAIAVTGYLVYCAVCILGNISVNIIGFIIITFLIIWRGYRITPKEAMLKTIVLTVLMMFGELASSLIVNVQISNSFLNTMTLIEGLLFSLFSKFLYALFIIILRQMSAVKNGEHSAKEISCLLLLPISTCLFFFLFNELRASLDKPLELLFVILSIMLILSNFIVYIVCEKLIAKNIQIQELEQIEYKKEIDEKSYRLIKDKYDELKIMIHDFNKYCSHIEAMLDNDRSDVRALTQKIRNKNNELLLADYTSSRALNVLLSQKLDECSRLGISFRFYICNIDLSFINEKDTVAIFANMIDNAIESCMESSAKEITLNINKMNNSFAVISVDNSADTAPVILKGRLLTRKADKANHGIGMLSIKKAISAYNGQLQWKYDKKDKLFSVSVIIDLPSGKNGLPKLSKNDRSCKTT